ATLNRSNKTVEGVERAREAADRALRANPEGGVGYLAKGFVLRDLNQDYEGALAQFSQGLQRDPNNVRLLVESSVAERTLGRWDQALAHVTQAQRIDPRSVPQARSLARALDDTRHQEEARQAGYVALALAPTNTAIIQQLAITFVAMGQLDSIHALLR